MPTLDELNIYIYIYLFIYIYIAHGVFWRLENYSISNLFPSYLRNTSFKMPQK